MYAKLIPRRRLEKMQNASYIKNNICFQRYFLHLYE